MFFCNWWKQWLVTSQVTGNPHIERDSCFGDIATNLGGGFQILDKISPLFFREMIQFDERIAYFFKWLGRFSHHLVALVSTILHHSRLVWSKPRGPYSVYFIEVGAGGENQSFDQPQPPVVMSCWKNIGSVVFERNLSGKKVMHFCWAVWRRLLILSWCYDMLGWEAMLNKRSTTIVWFLFGWRDCNPCGSKNGEARSPNMDFQACSHAKTNIPDPQGSNVQSRARLPPTRRSDRNQAMSPIIWGISVLVIVNVYPPLNEQFAPWKWRLVGRWHFLFGIRPNKKNNESGFTSFMSLWKISGEIWEKNGWNLASLKQIWLWLWPICWNPVMNDDVYWLFRKSYGCFQK